MRKITFCNLIHCPLRNGIVTTPTIAAGDNLKFTESGWRCEARSGTHWNGYADDECAYISPNGTLDNLKHITQEYWKRDDITIIAAFMKHKKVLGQNEQRVL
jgi:hypothetical protein